MEEATVTDMRRELIELGVREEYGEPRELHSGLESKVFWNIEKAYGRPNILWRRLRAIDPWIDQIQEYRPNSVMGIPTGGRLLAKDVAERLHVAMLKCPSLRWGFLGGPEHIRACRKRYPCILVDDVLTTGRTVSALLQRFGKEWNGKAYSPFVAVAVLVNRSGLDEIGGIPIISGIKCDPVEGGTNDTRQTGQG